MKTTSYNIYRDGALDRGLAFKAGSELETNCGLRQIGSVEAVSHEGVSPVASAFQSKQTNEYIYTGMPWPYDEVVVIH